MVIGYNGVLHCAVKGNPAPKISWFKNQLSILPKIGPKYRSCNQHGLIQLEVLRAKGRFYDFFFDRNLIVCEKFEKIIKTVKA